MILDDKNVDIIQSDTDIKDFSLHKLNNLDSDESKNCMILRTENECSFDSIQYSKIGIVYLGINISSSCNLSCSYCFKNQFSSKNNLTIEQIKDFIEKIIKLYPNLYRIVIDFSGSSEPLLNINEIEKTVEFCTKMCDNIGIELLPVLVTNGTLLHTETVKTLNKNRILYGVSIDGSKKQHNDSRIYINGKGSYSDILKNVKKIKNKKYIGAAVTINQSNINLIEIIRSLIKYFPTISMKISRNNTQFGINENNVSDLLINYSKLIKYILDKTIAGDYTYLGSIINGDDYLGKFITRIVLNTKVAIRCDAGIARFSLGGDENIYICSAALGLEKFKIGNLSNGIFRLEQNKIMNILTDREDCEGCPAKSICGGECLVNEHYNSSSAKKTDSVMCRINVHLYNISLSFVETLRTKYNRQYRILQSGCIEKQSRLNPDHEILSITKENKNIKYSELKEIKDNNYLMFTKIYNQYRDNYHQKGEDKI